MWEDQDVLYAVLSKDHNLFFGSATQEIRKQTKEQQHKQQKQNHEYILSKKTDKHVPNSCSKSILNSLYDYLK